jgi:hypothetical protein
VPSSAGNVRREPTSATMPTNRLHIPNLQHVRRLLSTGARRDHYYHRPTGIKLPHPNDPEFAAAYEAAERQLCLKRSSESPRATTDKVAAPPFVPQPVTAKLVGAADAHPPSDLEGCATNYLTPEEVVSRWRRRIDIDTLANWRSKKQGPTYHRFGRAVLYRADLLAAWESKNIIVCDPVTMAIDSEFKLGKR